MISTLETMDKTILPLLLQDIPLNRRVINTMYIKGGFQEYIFSKKKHFPRNILFMFILILLIKIKNVLTRLPRKIIIYYVMIIFEKSW